MRIQHAAGRKRVRGNEADGSPASAGSSPPDGALRGQRRVGDASARPSETDVSPMRPSRPGQQTRTGLAAPEPAAGLSGVGTRRQETEQEKWARTRPTCSWVCRLVLWAAAGVPVVPVLGGAAGPAGGLLLLLLLLLRLLRPLLRRRTGRARRGAGVPRPLPLGAV